MIFARRLNLTIIYLLYYTVSHFLTALRLNRAELLLFVSTVLYIIILYYVFVVVFIYIQRCTYLFSIRSTCVTIRRHYNVGESKKKNWLSSKKNGNWMYIQNSIYIILKVYELERYNGNCAVVFINSSNWKTTTVYSIQFFFPQLLKNF